MTTPAAPAQAKTNASADTTAATSAELSGNTKRSGRHAPKAQREFWKRLGLARPSPQGWAALSLSALVLIAAIAVRAPAAFPLSFAIVLALGWGMWRAPRYCRSLNAQWEHPAHCRALSACTIGVQLSHSEMLPPTRLLWRKPSVTAGVRSELVALTGLPALNRGRNQLHWPATFYHRGHHQLPDLHMRSGHPFGLVHWQQAVPAASAITVLPAVGNLTQSGRSALSSWSAEHPHLPHDIRGEDEPAHLRAYRPGDNPRRIHWRATAHHQALLISEREATTSQHLAIGIDTTCRTNPSPRFERLVATIATLIDSLEHDGWSITLHRPFQPAVHQVDMMHQELALIHPSEPIDISNAFSNDTPLMILGMRDEPESLPDSVEYIPLTTWENWVHLPNGVG